MFSWSNTGGSKPAPAYPGNRRASSTPQNLVAFNPGGTSTPVAGGGGSNTAFQDRKRETHIQSLVKHETLGPSTRVVSAGDDTTYDTAFLTKSGHTLIMRTYLPPGNISPPSLRLAGCRAQHDWIDPLSQSEIIGYTPLSSTSKWSETGISLGKAVHDVMQHLQLRPPVILSMDPSLIRRQSPDVQRELAASTAAFLSSGASIQQSADHGAEEAERRRAEETERRKEEEGFDIPLPPIPSTFVELQHMDAEELRNLISEEKDFVQLITSLDIVKNMEEFSLDIQKGNVKAARRNIDGYRADFESLSEEVEILSSELNLKVNEYQSLEEKFHQKVASGNGSDEEAVLASFDEARRAEEDASEEVATKFVDGDISLQEFIGDFMKHKKLFHMRTAKLELFRNL